MARAARMGPEQEAKRTRPQMQAHRTEGELDVA